MINPMIRTYFMFTESEKTILAEAAAIIKTKMRTTPALTSPDLAIELCTNRLVHKEQEVFAILLLDNQHRLIEFVEHSVGTISSASVYPREVVKLALHYNAAAVMFAHNHPSGIAEPSQSDRRITARLSDALALIDVRVLDHIVIGCGENVAFSKRGWI
ncbi:DNA repair protein RadC [Aliivibrio fischeri]|nr:DNA repair protein RadC [Aliivibrio fischeri]MUK76543.1 DNA repair protein RadC [Aliivibrio fischeri]